MATIRLASNLKIDANGYTNGTLIAVMAISKNLLKLGNEPIAPKT